MDSLKDPGYQAIRVTDRFSVKFDAQPEPTTWLVARRADDDVEPVKAYSVTIKDGALIFHDAPYRFDREPVIGLILAPGTWRSVCPEESA